MHFQPVRYFGKLSARDENGFMNNVFYLPTKVYEFDKLNV